jgi:hypothetical protein
MAKRSAKTGNSLPDEDSHVAHKKLDDAGFDSFDDWYEAVETCVEMVGRQRRVPAACFDDFKQTGMMLSWVWLMTGFGPVPNDRPASRKKYLAGVITIARRIRLDDDEQTIALGDDDRHPDKSTLDSPAERLAQSKELYAKLMECIKKLLLPEQQELMRVWVATGMNVAELARYLGWKYQRTFALFKASTEHLRKCLNKEPDDMQPPP